MERLYIIKAENAGNLNVCLTFSDDNEAKRILRLCPRQSPHGLSIGRLMPLYPTGRILMLPSMSVACRCSSGSSTA